jgi:hypothetical protein
VWSTGQQIQSAPLDIAQYTNATEFTKKPMGYGNQSTPQYTISFDVYVSENQKSWTAIFGHGRTDSWDNATNSPKINGRVPTVMFQQGTTRYIVQHAQKEGNTIKNAEATSATGLPLSKWVNITISVNNGTATVYRNGVVESSFTGKFYWPNAANDKWYWSPNGSYADPTGTLKVANFYFWPSALATTQIGALKVPAAPTPGVATTSYYEVEPYEK